MAVVTSGSFPIISNPRLMAMKKELKLEAATLAKGPGDKIFRQETTDVWEWESARMIPVGQMQRIQEGEDPPADQPREDYRIVRGIQFHGLAVLVTKYALQQSDRLRSVLVKSLAQSPQQTNESWYQAYYDNALQGVTVPTVNGHNLVDVRAFDGLSYFNASHTYLGVPGITNSNLSSTLRVYSTSAIISMMQQTAGWKTAKGQPMQSKVKALIVGDNLIGVANSFNSSEKDPGTNQNQPNIMRLQNYAGPIPKVIHWSYMGVSDFMLQLECTIDGIYGMCHAFLKGYKNLADDYPGSFSGRTHVFEVSQAGQVYGDDPYEFITNRAAV